MKKNSLMHVLSRACNNVQFVEPGYASTFFSYLGGRAGANALIDINGVALNAAEMQEHAASFEPSRAVNRPYQVKDGLAILPVSGTLLHKYGHLKPYSGSTGYDGLLARIENAINDPEIKAIMLDIDSPGGEAAGCFDAANRIKQFSQIKPIYALCYDTMCSAAMAIGSACTERWITQSGRAGSVGVVIAHASFEKQLKDDGVQITLLHSGKHKTDGNPYQNLSEEVTEKIQANLNKNRESFAQLVATNIGMSKQAVLDTEARVYQGQEAVDIGFANRLVNGAEAVPLLLDVIKTNNQIGVAMSATEQEQNLINKGAVTVLTQTDVDNARLEGATHERVRCKAILNCTDASGRMAMASHLAFETDQSAEQASALLKVSPAAATLETVTDKQSLTDGLTQAMDETEQPNLETSGDGEELSADLTQENSLLSSFDKATGNK